MSRLLIYTVPPVPVRGHAQPSFGHNPHRETRMFKRNAKKLESVMNSREGDEKLGDSADEATRRILVVDDEESIRVLLAEILTNRGYSVVVVVDGRQAVDLLESRSFDLIITDCYMPGVGGLEVMAAAKCIDPRCPIIVISGHPSSEGDMMLIGHPRAPYVQKPFDVELIQRTAATLLER